MFVTKEMAMEALKMVIDPEIGVSIVEMGLIYDVELNEKKKSVNVRMTLTSQMCPVGPYIIQNVEDAIMLLPDIQDVNVEIVWDPPWDPAAMASDEVKDKLGIW